MEQEKILYQTVIDAFSIYESLNTVEEFPDYSEDTLQTWAGFLYNILEKGSDSGLDEFIEAKKQAVDIICLLLNRFTEYMENYVQAFFEKIWDMIGKLPQEKTFNSFVTSITDYIQICLRQAGCREAIEKDLEYLFSEFLVHHMAFTESDLDEFEGNEDAFIKMDLEENDKETRRRSCFELVKVSSLPPYLLLNSLLISKHLL